MTPVSVISRPLADVSAVTNPGPRSSRKRMSTVRTFGRPSASTVATDIASGSNTSRSTCGPRHGLVDPEPGLRVGRVQQPVLGEAVAVVVDPRVAHDAGLAGAVARSPGGSWPIVCRAPRATAAAPPSHRDLHLRATPFRCGGEGSGIGRESWGGVRGWGGGRRSAGSPAGAARAGRSRRCRRCPPQTAVQPSPIRSATAPPSSSPSRGPPATTTMNTPWSRPRIRSGAADWRIVVRKTALTASDAAGERHRDERTPERLARGEHRLGAEQGQPEAR